MSQQDRNNNILYITVMSPHEENRIKIKYNIYYSLYGKVLIASTNTGICYIAFGKEKNMEYELKKRYSAAIHIKESEKVHDTALSLIDGKVADDFLPLHIKGTSFQLRVWEELLNIPYGETTTYKIIAENTGNPKAFRAVGSAVKENPISYIIPCHRVISSDKSLGGYHWGLGIKEMMLKNESAI
ncbi:MULTISPECIES: methylated-DNA--[protein]-cysteine S-methyltransferase [unclassified Proteiniphilum]|uniref:methylated-DNA--[protein]-cysteine S-methyltransferase n=1 Tax=unclassified Proteiniphilum TaxID=2622718 RepID=UPI0025798FBD|nr:MULTISPECIES: methylated-DNA--[protein]-cysteine S-methyltransferase [unclassified Proteiniphilum]